MKMHLEFLFPSLLYSSFVMLHNFIRPNLHWQGLLMYDESSSLFGDTLLLFLEVIIECPNNVKKEERELCNKG